MSLLIASTTVFLFFFFTVSESRKTNFEKCDSNGFVCDNDFLTFVCNNVTGQDVTLNVWQLNHPVNTTSLVISNCLVVRLNLGCSKEDASFDSIAVINVRRLVFLPSVLTRNPKRFHLENVQDIDTIPSYTFYQRNKKIHMSNCVVPVNDLESIYFSQVHIGRIETEAFFNLSNMKNFTWDRVTVLNIHVAAIKVKLRLNGEMMVRNSTLKMLENLSFQVYGSKWSMIGSRIMCMFPSALNGTVTAFQFSNNTVNIMESGGISVLSRSASILDNQFGYLHSGAFQKVGPCPARNRRMKFSYTFNGNLINFVDAGGLHPDFKSYEKLPSEITFSYNALFCSCEALAWMASNVSLGHTFSTLKGFYDMVLNDSNNNICASMPCAIHVSSIRGMISADGKCSNNYLVETVCDNLSYRAFSYSVAECAYKREYINLLILSSIVCFVMYGEIK